MLIYKYLVCIEYSLLIKAVLSGYEINCNILQCYLFSN